jgi:Holliday junction DNA helicase RuvA
MIGRLCGRLVGDGDGLVTLDVGGVGYDVTAPLGTIGRARSKDANGQLTLFVHTHLRQDALELFGFATELERRVFRLLLGVPGVGPENRLGGAERAAST